VSVTYNIKYAASGAVTENVFVHASWQDNKRYCEVEVSLIEE
jgi:hypothetical protein